MIKQYKLNEILVFVGQETQKSELHVSYGGKQISHNPFPFPFRDEKARVMILLEGKVELKLNLEKYVVKKNQIIIIPPQTVIEVIAILEPIRSIGVIFSHEFAIKTIFNFKEVSILRFLSLQKMFIWSLESNQLPILTKLTEYLYYLNSASEENYSEERLKYCFNLMVLEFMAIYKKRNDILKQSPSRKMEIVNAFLNLLTVHAKKERGIQFYANRIFITSTYLSRVLKEFTGNSSKKIIEDTVIMEARDLLLNTTLSIAQISDELSFTDPSTFGKFFLKMMKVTPKTFRNRFSQ